MLTELMNEIKCVEAVAPQESTSAATITGTVVDRLGYDSGVLFLQTSAASAAGTVTAYVYECATSGGTYTATGVSTSFAVATTTTTTKELQLNFRPRERYIKAIIVPPSATLTISGAAILGYAGNYPV